MQGPGPGGGHAALPPPPCRPLRGTAVAQWHSGITTSAARLVSANTLPPHPQSQATRCQHDTTTRGHVGTTATTTNRPHHTATTALHQHQAGYCGRRRHAGLGGRPRHRAPYPAACSPRGAPAPRQRLTHLVCELHLCPSFLNATRAPLSPPLLRRRYRRRAAAQGEWPPPAPPGRGRSAGDEVAGCGPVAAAVHRSKPPGGPSRPDPARMRDEWCSGGDGLGRCSCYTEGCKVGESHGGGPCTTHKARGAQGCRNAVGASTASTSRRPCKLALGGVCRPL